MDFGKLLSGIKQAFQPQPLVSPLPNNGLANPAGTPPPAKVEQWRIDKKGNTVPRFPNKQPEQEVQTPAPVKQAMMPSDGPRNPNWNIWKKTNPKGFQELLSGAQLASKKHGVPAGLLMDISGYETSGGTNLKPPKGHTAAGYFMFNDPTVGNPLRGMNASPEVARFMDNPDGFNRYSATESANLAAKLIKEKELARWAVLDKIQKLYSQQELSPYLR